MEEAEHCYRTLSTYPLLLISKNALSAVKTSVWEIEVVVTSINDMEKHHTNYSYLSSQVIFMRYL